jgi:hypothetical protein
MSKVKDRPAGNQSPSELHEASNQLAEQVDGYENLLGVLETKLADVLGDPIPADEDRAFMDCQSMAGQRVIKQTGRVLQLNSALELLIKRIKA